MIKKFVNQQTWDELVEFGESIEDPKFFPTLLQTFLNSGKKQAESLLDSGKLQDRKKCLYYAHSLKSTCATLGALDLAGQFSKIEKACHEEDDPVNTSDIDQAVNLFTQLHAQVEIELTKIDATYKA